jgi:TonB family protein
MKIVCDACQAKYSISDDKVQGKVFKIRCKKCSNIIVVRGGAGASEPASAPQEKDTRVYDYGYDGAGGGDAGSADDAVWHLVINQDQVGPLTAAEVQQRFAAGEIDGETFAWREGFADWLPLAQVDAFAGLVASGTTTTASSGSGAAAVSSMFGSGDDLGGTVRSDPGDLFAAASSGSRGAHHDDDGSDLFGSSKPAAAAAKTASAQKLRGERNENSVLFSLNNLAQLASDSPRPAAAASSSAGHATGAAGGEGSGLIDIRSMASAYLGSAGGAAVGKPSSSSSIGSIDDLPVFGGGGFSEPAVIVPTARASANNKMLYIMIGAVGLLAVVAIVMVVLLLKSGNKGPTQVANADQAHKADDKKADEASAKPTESGAEGSGSAEKAAEPEKKEPDKAGDKAADKAGEPEKKEPEKKEPEKHEPAKAASKSGSSSAKTTSSAPKTTTVAKTETKTETKAPADSGGCDEVSCVLNNYEGACCAKFRKGGSKPSGGGGGGGGGAKSDLPESLDRAMISNGIAAVKARVSTCGDRSPAKGKVKVKVQVGGDGRVSNVSVETSPDPALGACVSAAVQKATFAKTQKGGSFSYPFVF